MLSFSFLNNRRAQVAETMTWVVATIIIVFLIVSSIYVAVLLSQDKNLSLDKISSSSNIGWIDKKTSLSLDINNDNRQLILLWIDESSLLDSGGEDDS